MYFYYVWVKSAKYHSAEALTYSSTKKLAAGAILRVPLQKEIVMGLVVGSTQKPPFATKAIVESFALPDLPEKLLSLGAWLNDYYPASLGSITQQLLPVNLQKSSYTKKTDKSTYQRKSLPPLTLDQRTALALIDKPDTYLLHGKTGSGKTRLYTELAHQAIKAGRSAIILTPEISLTSQLAQRFMDTFGDQVIISHSGLTPVERRSIWLQILSSKTPLIVIGPRSALFSPLDNIGLVVVDEAHETAYKQDQAPHYLATRVAGQLAKLHNAVLILGSATPSITDYYLALEKHKPIIELNKLAQQNNFKPTNVVLVDLKDHSLFTRSPHISNPLIEAIEVALGRKEQTLLYLNRRGTARTILCQNCGWQALCPNCDLPLTYHGDSHKLRCHSCSYQQASVLLCPICNHHDVTFKTMGTKALVQEVQRLFPQARLQRFDTDNPKAERFEQHYTDIRAGQTDIIIGTQILAKGLDLPRLSTLGVILADSSLYLPDFSAQERTYQLLSQVLGRVGRGHVAGKAIIQTYQPANPLIKSAITSNYKTFYDTELSERQQFSFPPFFYLLKLSCRRATTKGAEKAATNLKQLLETKSFNIRIEGPAPAFYEKSQGKYQWQLVVKAKSRSELLKVILVLPKVGWSYDIDPTDLL